MGEILQWLWSATVFRFKIGLEVDRSLTMPTVSSVRFIPRRARPAVEPAVDLGDYEIERRIEFELTGDERAAASIEIERLMQGLKDLSTVDGRAARRDHGMGGSRRRDFLRS